MNQYFLVFLDILQRDYVKYPLLAVLCVLVLVFAIGGLIRDNLAMAGWEKKRFKKVNGRKVEVSDRGKYIVRDGDTVFEIDTVPGESITVSTERIKDMDEAKPEFEYDDTDEANASMVVDTPSLPKKKFDDTENAIVLESKPFVSGVKIMPEYRTSFTPIDLPKIFRNKTDGEKQIERVTLGATRTVIETLSAAEVEKEKADNVIANQGEPVLPIIKKPAEDISESEDAALSETNVVENVGEIANGGSEQIDSVKTDSSEPESTYETEVASSDGGEALPEVETSFESVDKDSANSVTEFPKNADNVEVDAPSYCLECGEKLEPHAKFCGNCGTKVVGDVACLQKQVEEIVNVDSTNGENDFASPAEEQSSAVEVVNNDVENISLTEIANAQSAKSSSDSPATEDVTEEPSVQLEKTEKVDDEIALQSESVVGDNVNLTSENQIDAEAEAVRLENEYNELKKAEREVEREIEFAKQLEKELAKQNAVNDKPKTKAKNENDAYLKRVISHTPNVGEFDEAVVFGRYQIMTSDDGKFRYHLFTNKNEAIYGRGGFDDIKILLSHINSFKLAIKEGTFSIAGNVDHGYRFILKRGEAEFKGIIVSSKEKALKTIEEIKYYGLTEIIRKD